MKGQERLDKMYRHIEDAVLLAFHHLTSPEYPSEVDVEYVDDAKEDSPIYIWCGGFEKMCRVKRMKIDKEKVGLTGLELTVVDDDNHSEYVVRACDDTDMMNVEKLIALCEKMTDYVELLKERSEK